MHPNLQHLHNLHQSARHDLMRRFLETVIAMHPLDRLPPRAALQPQAMPYLLPHLVLTKVEYWPERVRFKFTVIGQATADTLGLHLANRYMDEVQAAELPSLSHAIEDRQHVVDEGQAVYRFGNPRMRHNADFVRIELCHTPLADDGAKVSHILSLAAFEGLT